MSAETIASIETPSSGEAQPGDRELCAWLALARIQARYPKPTRPNDVLQAVCDAAHTISRSRYAALAITDENDRTEGFFTSGLTAAQLKGLKVPPAGHGPLGSLRTDGKPVRINDLDRAEHAFGFPPKHPVMQRMLGVPLWANGVVRGSMYVTDREDGEPFDDDDERALLALARHVQYIIENFWY